MKSSLTILYHTEISRSTSLIRWFSETAVLTVRDLQHWRMQPGPVIVGWLFPVMITLMFGGLFGGAMSVPGHSDYFSFVIPGMLVLTMLFGLEGTMMAVSMDASRGITERFRSLPISASTLVTGRCVADILNSLIGLILMVAAGLMLGWRWHGNAMEAVLCLALLLFLRFSLLWIGIYMGLAAKSPQSVSVIQILVWPISFLSNIFVDPRTMPNWLGLVANWNPLSTTVTVIRGLSSPRSVAAGDLQWALLASLASSVLLSLVFIPLACRKFRRLGQ